MKYLFILFSEIILLIASTAVYADSRLDNCLPYKEEISSILKSENIKDISSLYGKQCVKAVVK